MQFPDEKTSTSFHHNLYMLLSIYYTQVSVWKNVEGSVSGVSWSSHHDGMDERFTDTTRVIKSLLCSLAPSITCEQRDIDVYQAGIMTRLLRIKTKHRILALYCMLYNFQMALENSIVDFSWL